MKRRILAVSIVLFISLCCIGSVRMPKRSFLTWNVEDALLAYYSLDENAASATVIDAWGGNTGTGVRNTNLYSVTGKIGNALDFDGTDDKINCGSNFIASIAISITAWIYPEGWGETEGWIVNNGGGGEPTVFYINDTNNCLRLLSGGVYRFGATNGIALNKWQFVAVTLALDGTVNLYIDGVLSGSANQVGGVPGAGNTNVFIGNITSDNKTFDGYIDNLMIFSRVLSEKEIKGLYNRGRGIDKGKWYY